MDSKVIESDKNISFNKGNKICNEISDNNKSILDINENNYISEHNLYKINIELIEF